MAILFILQAHPAAILALDPDSGETRTVLSPGGVPDGIQADPKTRTIFWTNMGAWPATGEDFYAADGTIERCSFDGSGHQVLVGDGAIVTPKQMQYDAVEGRLYWCDREGMAIWRCYADGSKLTRLLSTGSFPGDMHDVVRHCVGIAIDRKNRHLYWTQKGPPNGGLGRIFRMALDIPLGSSAETRGDVQLMKDNLPEPIDLEIDHERGRLYWTDRGDPAAGGNSLNRASITAGGLGDHEVLATGLKEGIGLALDPARRRAFVGDLSGAIRVIQDDGRGLSTIHQCAAPVTGLAFIED